MHQALGSLLKTMSFHGCKYIKKHPTLILSPILKTKIIWIWVCSCKYRKNAAKLTTPPNCDQKVHVYTDLNKILSKAEFCFKVWEML